MRESNANAEHKTAKIKSTLSVAAEFLTNVGIGKNMDPVDGKRVLVVLLGKEGAGKTTLFNRMTSIKRRTGYGGKGGTCSLLTRPVSYSEYSYDVRDVPGLTSDEKQLEMAFAIQRALCDNPLNLILICAKYERIGTTLDSLEASLECVCDFPSHVVCCLTHWDLCENDPDEEWEIIKSKIHQRLDIDKVFCVGKYTSPEDICDTIYHYAHKNPQKSIEINNRNFLWRFNIGKNSMKVQKNRMAKDFRTYVEKYKTLLRQAKAKASRQEAAEVAHAVFLQVKREAEELAGSFAQQHSATMALHDCYIEYIAVKKQLAKYVYEVTEEVKYIIGYDLLDESDLRNRIRKCQYCHTVWYKTRGCDGETICGNRPILPDWNLSRPHKVELKTNNEEFSYTISREQHHAIQVLRKDGQPIPDDELDKAIGGFNHFATLVAMSAKPEKGEGGIGCGNVIVWKDQLPLLNEELEEIICIKTTDYEADNRDEWVQDFEKWSNDKRGEVALDDEELEEPGN
eukprot:TRINITY_DN3856_c0_g1_i1.p1 TRINITY_DN3856_c0_g1~~TRINITY_DN3856_c0_g1_i1.p1  ORF type:complete len:512 (-),score=78.02 TRINITY_DN3856_c0_g1_i1:49-1584(-)